MQIKTLISLPRYGVITFFHIGITYYKFGVGNELVLAVCFLSYLLNHTFLVVAMHKLVFTEAEHRDNVGILLLFGAKLLILATGIWFGIENFKGNELIITGNYIFQLIILILSIKRLR